MLVLAALTMAACGSRDATLEDLQTRIVTLPNGREIRAEIKTTPEAMRFGMMFRDSLPKDTGMLFVHGKPGAYNYWMHNVRIPLDIIFMDSQRTILGIAAGAAPCNLEPNRCTQYGSNANTRYVLEVAGGEARRLGLKPGDVLRF
jgi:uncharacterized membrane protein (UPF0127 family)